MTEVCDLINPEAVSAWLARFANHDPHIHKLLTIGLEPMLKSRQENLRPVETLPADAPEWLRSQWNKAARWYEFDPRKDIRLTGRVHQFANAVESAVKNHEEWLQKKDVRGYPVALLRIRTMDDAMDILKDLDNGVLPRISTASNIKDSEVVHTFDDGYTVVQLLTPAALRAEGTIMQNCLGRGYYDYEVAQKQMIIFSLHDEEDNPHVTMRVEYGTNRLLECRGKQNTAPVEKYFPYLRTFFEKRNFVIDEGACFIGVVRHNGEFYDIFNLPEDFECSGLSYFHTTRQIHLPAGLKIAEDLKITHYGRPLDLPRRLEVKGQLQLSGCPLLKALPDDMRVGKLTVSCNTNLAAIPPTLHREGPVEITYCPGISVLGDNFQTIHGNMTLFGCTGLRSLPPHLWVKYIKRDDPLYETYAADQNGDLRLEGCSALEELPRFLKVDGHLFLYGCVALRKLPEHIEVFGRIYTDFGIFSRVESFIKAFHRHIGTPEET